MRNVCGFLMFVLAGLYSCSTKIDLYADYKDTTIVYGVMNVAQDTNFIRITRAFSGSNDEEFDTYQITQIADSLNYPGKLDARLIELKNQGNSYVPTGREIALDTITIHNKQEGLFYAPDQKMYYTTSRFRVNDGNEKYRYKLSVIKPNRTDTVTSEIGLLGGSNFQIQTEIVYFRSENSAKIRKLYFTPDDNEVIYQIDLQFNYKEVRGNQDTVMKAVQWTLGSFSKFDLGYENGSCYVTYPENALFTLLSSAIGDDILYVERFFSSFIISISAYGVELYNYMLTNGSSIDYTYTNIHGGVGVFSSSYKLEKNVSLSSLTMTDLLSMHWGFKNLGYKD